MDKNPNSPLYELGKGSCSSQNSALEEAKAKQNSLRERLAARRQLLASVTGTNKPLTSKSLTISHSLKKTLTVPHSSLIKNALKRKNSDTNLITNTDALSVAAHSLHLISNNPCSTSNITEFRKGFVKQKIDLSNQSEVSSPDQSNTDHSVTNSASHEQQHHTVRSSNSQTVPETSSCNIKTLNNSTKGDSTRLSCIRTQSASSKTNSVPTIGENLDLSSRSKCHNTATSISNDTTSTITSSTTAATTTTNTTASSTITNTTSIFNNITTNNNNSTNNSSINNAKSNERFDLELENLLGAETMREKEIKRVREEVMDLLNRPTIKERYLTERFRSQGGSQVQQFCSHGTRIECSKVKTRTGDPERCTKLHFRKIIHPHTDESLGDCSFLNTCFHVDTCKYVHYTIDYSDYVPTRSSINTDETNIITENGNDSFTSKLLNKSDLNSNNNNNISNNMNNNNNLCKIQSSENLRTCIDGNNGQSVNENGTPLTLYPPQWINCDIRLINMSILGKFSVIMADPPWDIHMELPYGTMSDDEMRRLDIPCLQDDGYLFLWVTGRAMELGRECLRLWGYQRVDEVIWVKTNQLQRLIRTGRTGHWLNHGKEHCLVGVKGNPQGVNRGLDCDIIVSEVRETSHKPDEIYGIIERLSPGTRKLELFGRPHNLQPNWITLGNQLDGTYLVDPAVVERFKKQYPNGLDNKTK